jgi:hypothetical protein
MSARAKSKVERVGLVTIDRFGEGSVKTEAGQMTSSL